MHKLTKDRLISACLILALALLVTYIGFRLFRSMNETAIGSCISSVRAALIFSLRKDRVREAITLDREWRTLNENEKEILFRNIDEPKSFDCSRFPYYREGKTATGENLQIIARNLDGSVDVRIEGFPLQ